MNNSANNNLKNRIWLTTGIIIGIAGSVNNLVNAGEKTKADEKADSGLFQSRYTANQLSDPEYQIFSACPLISTEQRTSHNTQMNQERVSAKIGSIKLTADHVPQDDEKKTVLEGNVTMRSSSSLLLADKLVTDKQKAQVMATGNVSLETTESLLRAEKFIGDQNSESSSLSKVRFHFYSNNANGKAETLSLESDKTATLKELTFSTCPEGDNSWRFSAGELQLDQSSGRGEAWGMWLKVSDIPVFYFPYLNFPIDDQRKSGLIAPSISNNSRNGIDLTLPIYWNIAPQADATFRPRYIQNRGEQLGVEFRYLNSVSENELALEWLDNDELVEQLIDLQPTLAAGDYGLDEERWAFSFHNKTRFNQNWTASVNASRVSDRDYFRDLGIGLIQSQLRNGHSQLLSEADITYQDDIWFVSLFTESVQSFVGDEPYRVLPSLVSSADYFDSERGLRWQFESDFSRFEHNDKSLTFGQRLNLLGSLSYPMQNSYSWLTPKASYQLTHYQQQLEISGEKDSLSRNLPIFSLDSGLFFDRQMSWGENGLVHHSLEPRLFYAYIPHEEQDSINVFDSRLPDFSFNQLWRENRFYGVDRVGDTDHLSIAITNRFVKSDTGEQLLAISLGRKLYFDDRRVALTSDSQVDQNDYSPWLLDVSYTASDTVELSGFIEWSDTNRGDSQVRGTNIARSRIKFEPIEDHIVNLSHRVRNNQGFENEEIDLSFAWPINDEWRLVGRWYNDLKNDRSSETLFGFEYESCCWAVSIVSHRYLDVRLDSTGNPLPFDIETGVGNEFNSGIQLQFVFKGLGNPGEKSVSKLLEKSIRGYRSRF